jgi:hypothetical protein
MEPCQPHRELHGLSKGRVWTECRPPGVPGREVESEVAISPIRNEVESPAKALPPISNGMLQVRSGQ